VFARLGAGGREELLRKRVTFTNPVTDVSVTYVISGQLSVTPTDDGEILRFTGHNVVVGPEIGILYATGNQTFVVDAVDGTTTLTESHGKVVNVCDVLAP
jgi:hypothetical protein